MSQIKDAELIAVFKERRGDFEKLKQMAMEDSGSIGYISEKTLKKSSLSEGRQNDYATLLSRIRPGLSVGAGPQQVTFHFAQGGAALAIGRSWTKGITYLPGGAKGCTVVKNLDERHVDDGVYVVPIEADWYLIYSQLD